MRCFASVSRSGCCFRCCALKRSQSPISFSDCSLRLIVIMMLLRLQQEVHVAVVVEGDADAVLAHRLHLWNRKTLSRRENCQHQDQHAVLQCNVCCIALLRRSACVGMPGCSSSRDLVRLEQVVVCGHAGAVATRRRDRSRRHGLWWRRASPWVWPRDTALRTFFQLTCH